MDISSGQLEIATNTCTGLSLAKASRAMMPEVQEISLLSASSCGSTDISQYILSSILLVSKDRWPAKNPRGQIVYAFRSGHVVDTL